MPPQSLLPSWSMRQLVCNVNEFHFRNKKAPWISFILEIDMRNFFLAKTIPQKDKFGYKPFTLLAKFHSRCRILSSPTDVSATLGLPDEATSDTKVKKEPPLVKDVISEKNLSGGKILTVRSKLDRVLSQQREFADSRALEEDLDKSPDLKPDEIASSSLPGKGVQPDFSEFSPKCDKKDLESTQISKVTNHQPTNVSHNNEGILRRSLPQSERSIVLSSVDSINTQTFIQDKLETDNAINKDQESLPQNIKISNLISNPRKSVEFTSLFDELFPEELAKENTAIEKRKRAIIRLETLPIFNWKPKKGRKKSTPTRHILELDQKKERMKAEADLSSSSEMQSIKTAPLSYENLNVLSLNACSISLEESDFFRLGSKGEHIESWTNGIVKVIPVRNENTLRCIGSYLILFSTEASARAYREQIVRIHTLSRKKEKSDKLMLPVKSKHLLEGENIDSLLKSFSLVPGYARLSLKLLKRPFKPTISNILRCDGPVGTIKLRTNTDNLVLFYLDIGNISLDDFKDFINQDGKRRNSHWNLLGGVDKVIEVKDTENKDPGTLVGKFKEKNSQPRPSSYILPFAVEYEARRFVREWHRRPLSLRKKKQDKDDHYVPMANAEILW